MSFSVPVAHCFTRGVINHQDCGTGDSAIAAMQGFCLFVIRRMGEKSWLLLSSQNCVSSALWNCAQFRMQRPEQLPGTQPGLSCRKSHPRAVLWGQGCSDPTARRLEAAPLPREGSKLQELLCTPHTAAGRGCWGASGHITVAGHCFLLWQWLSLNLREDGEKAAGNPAERISQG